MNDLTEILEKISVELCKFQKHGEIARLCNDVTDIFKK